VINLPDVNGREMILKVHARKVKLHPSVDLHTIARGTPGFSGAELEALINESALIAAMESADWVSHKHLEESRDKVRWGRARKGLAMSEEDKRATAYHEAGHTVVQMLTGGADPVHKVTIIPRGMALGATFSLPERDVYKMDTRSLEAFISVAMGGRIADEIFNGAKTTGASNDIEQATTLARRMVCEWGMSERLGPVKYSEEEEHPFLGQSLSRVSHVSQEKAAIIDQEIASIIDRNYERARTLIQDNRDQVVAIADALMEFETLNHAELVEILAGRSVADYRKRFKETPPLPEPRKRPAEFSGGESPDPGALPGPAPA
jgi:cell division protease FtsH